MKIYADTSVLCSLYVTDANSPKADAWRQANPVPLDFTGFHRLELRNALSLAVFQQRLTPAESLAAWQEVEQDLAAGLLVANPACGKNRFRKRSVWRSSTRRSLAAAVWTSCMWQRRRYWAPRTFAHSTPAKANWHNVQGFRFDLEQTITKKTFAVRRIRSIERATFHFGSNHGTGASRENPAVEKHPGVRALK